jgi:hypothetical protein
MIWFTRAYTEALNILGILTVGSWWRVAYFYISLWVVYHELWDFIPSLVVPHATTVIHSSGFNISLEAYGVESTDTLSNRKRARRHLATEMM